jgi:hypothetical protein
MEQIAEGKGRAPKPFMTAKSGRGKADAVWHSNRGDAAEARAEKKTKKPNRRPRRQKAGKSRRSRIL